MRGHRGRLALGLALAVVLLAAVFWKTDWTALRGAFEKARLLPLIAVSLVTLVVYVVRAWRWGYLLAPLGRVRFLDLFSATMVGFATFWVIPRAGEIVRPWLVSRRYPIPVSAGFATIIIERLIDLITVLLLFAAYLFVLPPPPMQTGGRLMELVKIAGAATGAGAIAVLALLLALHAWSDRVLGVMERLLTRAPRWLAEPLGRIVRAFSEGLAVLRAPASHLAVVAGQSLVLWLLIGLGFHLNHQAYSLDLPFHATFLLIAFLVVGVAIPTPGMVGGFHAFYLLALHEVYGVDRATAVAAGFTAHALTNLPILIGGAAFMGREGLNLGRVARVADEADGVPGDEAGENTDTLPQEVRS